ncbi:TonB-dependent receptor [Oleomonas cavernae]|uniref:TonB-dependent receptor n=1 Tax=Oleomonas cavernae TaxID=2320859 RepID=UPI001314DA95|nr:TonB-dependent receptor [Oleomonas cavernae]
MDRSNWYGTQLDHDDTVADIVTVRLSHRANDWLQIANDTRVGYYTRDFLPTAPSCNSTNNAANGGSNCLANLFDGNPATVPFGGLGGPSSPYYLDQWGAQNVTTATADFSVGGFKNQFIAGLDVSYEYAERTNTVNTGLGRPTTSNLLDPTSPDWSPNFIASTDRETDSTSFALFVSEQFWITDELSILAGLRWEDYKAESDLTDKFCPTQPNTVPVPPPPVGCSGYSTAPTPTTPGNYIPRTPGPTVSSLEVSEDLLDPKASVIWEPTESQTYYVSWSKSSQPATGAAAGNASTPISETQQALKPTTGETYEAGAKFGLFGDKLGLGLSVFQIERDNVKTLEGGEVVAAGQSIRSRGFEVSATGQITDKWVVQASYAYLDAEVLNFGNANPLINAAIAGKEATNAPENSASLWTTYMPFDDLTLGGGVQYRDEVVLNYSATVAGGVVTGVTENRAPYYLSFDAMASYEIGDGVVVQVNGYNLLDRDDNYAQTQNSRLVPAAGRTVIFSTQATF